ncbi:DNA mismatch repair protein MutS [Halopelagius fulvigenes]|uniref:DNA mismatch repair protein MutS n=1 Tax=Halopelagius fulvigenes TaxID=1198324 RepID=A0ABD5U022_9EURY
MDDADGTETHADDGASSPDAGASDEDLRPEGPPQKLLANREELTPMLSQYLDLCEAHPDAVVLFQVGDFYEAFCEAAEMVARVCEVTLTKREDSTGRYPMAGIPIDNAASYLESLLDSGYRVAIADQVEDAEEASGLVDRAVTNVVTPGTVVEDELLDAATATYVGAVARESDGRGDDTYAFAALDVSTGECQVTSADRLRIAEELERLEPAELLFGPGVALDTESLAFEAMVTDHDPGAFDAESAAETLSSYLANPEAVLSNPTERRACGALLDYAEYTQGDDGALDYVSRVRRYDPRRTLQLDATALRSLELFESRSHRSGDTLADAVDETACALGRRRLVSWLRRPLLDRSEIERRHDAVAEWVERPMARETVRDSLADVYDVERLIARVSRGRANARDLRSLKATLDVVPDLKDAMSEVESDALVSLRESLDELEDVRALIGDAIRPDPPQEVTEGGVVREGFDDELDELRATEREGREWVANLEERERERTGIDSLDVGYNQVHGYYIEVTNPNLDRVPDDYTRRQTLKNSERFYTPELKRREDEILGAAEKADALEYEVFREVREAVAEEADRVQSLADSLADLDVLTSFAAVAAGHDYVRPEMGAADVRIEGGRHPVVERARDEFVPNEADFTDGHVAVITGPNMSGKSTYMRQVALIAVLAQAGSFVPADAAELPILDRVFTRVGASDDIAGGQSTFMREMAELTDILHNATEDSLVLLDEVGRGTSTADGLAIARATTEFVHDEVGATTLFATHYHDLTALADELPNAFNLHFTVSKRGGDGDGGDSGGPDVTFLHRVAEGASSSSYGVEVAKMAGVPDAVVERAREYVADAERSAETGVGADAEPEARTESRSPGESHNSAERQERATNGRAENGAFGDEPSADGDPSTDDERPTDGTLAAYVDGLEPGGDQSEATPAERDVAEEIRELDIAGTTPLEALNTLNELKRKLDD